ncbi:hypothetical protein ACLOJK_035665 [Asimina triloba]
MEKLLDFHQCEELRGGGGPSGLSCQVERAKEESKEVCPASSRKDDNGRVALDSQEKGKKFHLGLRSFIRKLVALCKLEEYIDIMDRVRLTENEEEGAELQVMTVAMDDKRSRDINILEEEEVGFGD